MTITIETIKEQIKAQVSFALEEDIGTGDITAELIPEEQQARASVISREAGILCGQAWVDEVYRQIDTNVQINWLIKDGEKIQANQKLFELQGKARSLLSGERCALNFLQTLSGTASTAYEYQKLIGNSPLKLLDTRKTIPGLRLAQKYAVSCGGCFNHRIGLYDSFLIKENHIAACGGIKQAISRAKQRHPDKTVEVEVENLEEFKQAQDAGADIIMLDNFSMEDIHSAVQQKNQHSKIEVSGGITKDSIPLLAKTGADFISIGALTKHCQALDLSFRLE